MSTRPVPSDERRAIPEPWPGYPECPSGCGATGLKLNRFGHVVGCVCAKCRNRNNRIRGKAANRRAHLSLGGGARTVDDDLFYSYSINVAIEAKTGAQIGTSFPKFVRGKWATDAFRQAEKKIPIGTDALASLYLELAPSEAYLVVRVPAKGLRG